MEYIFDCNLTVSGCNALSAADVETIGFRWNPPPSGDYGFVCHEPTLISPSGDKNGRIGFGGYPQWDNVYPYSWAEYLCLPKVTVPDVYYKTYLVLEGCNFVISRDEHIGFNISLYTGKGKFPTSADPGTFLEDLSEKYVNRVNPAITPTYRFPEKNIYVDLSDSKGKTIFIRLRQVKGLNRTYGVRGYIRRIYVINSVYLENEIYETDLILSHDLSKRRLYNFDVKYNQWGYSIKSDYFRVKYDIEETSYRSMPDLSIKYHLLEESGVGGHGRAIIVNNTDRVQFQLLSIKQPENVLIEGYISLVNIDISQTVGDFCCPVSITTNTRWFYDEVYLPFIDIAGKYQRYYIKLLIDEQEECNLLLEDCAADYGDMQRTWTYNGRTLQCLLDEPYGFLYKYVKPKVSSGYVYVSDYLNNVWNHANRFIHYFRDLIIGSIPNNPIPEEQLTIKDKSYATIISEICDTFELMLIPHFNGDIEIKRKREWIGIKPPLSPGIPSIDHTITNLSGMKVMNMQESAREWKNRIKIIGDKDKIEGDVDIYIAQGEVSSQIAPGQVIKLEVYSTNTRKAFVETNLGSLALTEEGSWVDSTLLSLGNKSIKKEETVSLTNRSFRTKYNTGSIPINKVYCIEDGRYYSIDSYNPLTNIYYIKGTFPREQSYISYSYTAKYFGNIWFKAPNMITQNIIVTASTRYAESRLRLATSLATFKLKLYVEKKELPAQTGSWMFCRVYTTIENSLMMGNPLAILPNRRMWEWGTDPADHGMVDPPDSYGWAYGGDSNNGGYHSDPYYDAADLEDETTLWKPTLEEIEEEGFKNYFKFIYIAPDLEDEFVNGDITENISVELIIKCKYRDPDCEGDEEECTAQPATATFSLTEPTDFVETNLAVVTQGSVNELDNQSISTIPVYVLSTHDKSKWGGIKAKWCSPAGGGYLDLQQVPQIPDGLVQSGDSATNAYFVDGGIRCGTESGGTYYSYYYKADVPLYKTNDARQYPLNCQFHVHRARGGQSVANASCTLTTNLGSVNVYMAAQNFDTKEFIYTDNTYPSNPRYYRYRKFSTYIYFGWSKYSIDGGSYDDELCIGSWDDVSSVHGFGSYQFQSFNEDNAMMLNSLMNDGSGDQGFSPGATTSSVVCYGGGEDDASNAKIAVKYKFYWGSGREYVFVAGLFYKKVCLGFQSITFHDNIVEVDSAEG